MLLTRLSALTLSLGLWLSAPGIAFARCACLDSLDEVAKQAEQQAALQRLPSEANRTLARNFRGQHLNQDALHYYQLAIEQAQGECQAAPSADNTSVPARITHAVDVEREAAAFAAFAGAKTSAAAWRETAVNHDLQLHNQFDAGQDYGDLANLFEAAGNKAKAAEYCERLAQYLSSTVGRYDERTRAAQAAFQRLTGLANK